MKELEMLADAIAAEDEMAAEPASGASLDDLVEELQKVAVQFAEAVGALKANAESAPVEPEPEPEPEPASEEGDDDEQSY